MEKILKQVCSCENCGNEAEMELTCSFVEYEQAEKVKKAGTDHTESRIRAKGTCSHCGNEADMWIDI